MNVLYECDGMNVCTIKNIKINNKHISIPRRFHECNWLTNSKDEKTRGIVPQSIHKVANADFWRTSHHDGKICPGWCGLQHIYAHPLWPITIMYKVAVYAPAERADTPPSISSLPYMHSVDCPLFANFCTARRCDVSLNSN